jgi:hypothetical protein
LIGGFWYIPPPPEPDPDPEPELKPEAGPACEPDPELTGLTSCGEPPLLVHSAQIKSLFRLPAQSL